MKRGTGSSQFAFSFFCWRRKGRDCMRSYLKLTVFNRVSSRMKVKNSQGSPDIFWECFVSESEHTLLELGQTRAPSSRGYPQNQGETEIDLMTHCGYRCLLWSSPRSKTSPARKLWWKYNIRPSWRFLHVKLIFQSCFFSVCSFSCKRLTDTSVAVWLSMCVC